MKNGRILLNDADIVAKSNVLDFGFKWCFRVRSTIVFNRYDAIQTPFDWI